MNAWLVTAAAVLAAGLGPVVWGVSTGPLKRRSVAQNAATTVVCLVILLLAQGYQRPSYTDLAVVLSVLGPVGTLVYARLLMDDLCEDPPRTRLPTILLASATVPVVMALCVAAGPGRAALKIVLTGVLLVAGNVVASRALSRGCPKPEKAHHL
ncbi:MrpF/PhaF family protein [Streptomyces sp. ITFR-6]|uniref:MrpF/PhaF family protein n=1 Tax=Streptomyces sp. ITFR-6 TaxID=3075197 RepID=UPI0028897B68|nr:MrpF/PhaF family protein [Streptomyces sp. ITFR-6]WNI27653.1 MrpF/PhaF family protein [Streptomyces sp. ITFR-6]